MGTVPNALKLVMLIESGRWLNCFCKNDLLSSYAISEFSSFETISRLIFGMNDIAF